MSAPDLEQGVSCLWPRGDGPDEPQVYAVVDAARSERLLRAVRTTRLESGCLFEGETGPELAASVPYIVHLARDSALTRDLLDSPDAARASLFLVVGPGCSLQQIRRLGLRLMGPWSVGGAGVLLRWYDPEVMHRLFARLAPLAASSALGPVLVVAYRFARPYWTDRLAALRGAHEPDGKRHPEMCGSLRVWRLSGQPRAGAPAWAAELEAIRGDLEQAREPALCDYALEFVRRVAGAGSKGRDEADVLPVICEAVVEAGRLGLRSRQAVAVFADLWLRAGFNPVADPEIAAILQQHRFPEVVRLGALCDLLASRLEGAAL